MDKIAICIVTASESDRSILFEKLNLHCSAIILLQNVEDSFYRRHLSGFQDLCLIVDNALITPVIKKNVISYQHVLLPLYSKGQTPNAQDIFVNADDTYQSIGDKIQALIRVPVKTHQETQLSDRETEIVKLVARGLTNKEIADTLFISPHTVMTHRKNISARLGIKTISGLTVYAILKNIISVEEASL